LCGSRYLWNKNLTFGKYTALDIGTLNVLKIVLSGYFGQKPKQAYTVFCPFFTETQSGYNQKIRWKDAFYLFDTQIQIYPAISTGGVIILSKVR